MAELLVWLVLSLFSHIDIASWQDRDIAVFDNSGTWACGRLHADVPKLVTNFSLENYDHKACFFVVQEGLDTAKLYVLVRDGRSGEVS